MAEKARCEICNRNFKDTEGLAMHNKAKHAEPVKEEKKPLLSKKVRNWAIFVIIVVGIIFIIFWGISSVKILPPSTTQGHIEESPPSHIMKEPIPDVIQRHMLEHADGSGPPGVIINYNCEDYDCESDLIENLEAFAEKYPAHVYVAPFPKMDAKIALTRQGRIEILEEYDEDRINRFVR